MRNGGAHDSAGDDQFAEFDGRRRPEEHDAPSFEICPTMMECVRICGRSVVQARAGDRRALVRLGVVSYAVIMLIALLSILASSRHAPTLLVIATMVVATGLSRRARGMDAESLSLSRRDGDREELLAMEEGRTSAAMVRHHRALGRAGGSLDPRHLRLALLSRDFNSEDYEALLALDDDVTAQTRRGADQVQINRLACYTVTSRPDASKGTCQADPLVCAICLECLAAGDQARILPCLHQFHKECVDRWLADAATCPVCKADPFDMAQLVPHREGPLSSRPEHLEAFLEATRGAHSPRA